jgi:hypothetical protein
LNAINEIIAASTSKWASHVVTHAGEQLGIHVIANAMLLVDPERITIFAPRQLAHAKNYPLARKFQKGVRAGIRQLIPKDGWLAPSPTVKWATLTSLTTAVAAAAAAKLRILEDPAHWVPFLLHDSDFSAA